MEALPVTIILRSRQMLDGEASHLEQRLSGTLSPREDGWQLCYREPSGEGGETRLTLAAEEAALERSGPMEMRMRFQSGAVHPARCRTPYGGLELSVETEYLRHALTPEGGRVLIRYRLSAQGQSLGHFALQLHVQAAERRSQR